MKRLINYFELKADGKYRFEWADITSIMYVVCVAGIICGYDTTILFVITCGISLITCIKARRINLIVINTAFVVLNLFYLIG